MLLFVPLKSINKVQNKHFYVKIISYLRISMKIGMGPHGPAIYVIFSFDI